MKNELISIIIPVYNAEKYIKRCVESVLKQTYRNFEVVVIDDGSKDATKAIIKEMQDSNKQLFLYETMHFGVSAARNKGLEVARGEFIAFVDADDEISPFYLETLFGIIKKYHAQIAVCGICHMHGKESYSKKYRVNEASRKSVQVQTGREFLLRMEEPFRYEKTAVCWNKLYKREIFEAIRYPSGKIYEDSAIMQDILYPVSVIAETEEVLYFYHTESAGITRSTYSLEKLDEIWFAKKRMYFFRKRRERTLYSLARKQYCIALLKHYYLSKKTKTVSKRVLFQLRQELKKYLKGYGWKKNLSLKTSFVFEVARFVPYVCGFLIVNWDVFLEKNYRTKR